jgi:hypothetical protein
MHLEASDLPPLTARGARGLGKAAQILKFSSVCNLLLVSTHCCVNQTYIPLQTQHHRLAQ